MLDTITIRNFKLNVFLGVYDSEQSAARPVSVDFTLFTDISTAGQTDNVADTVDYDKICCDIKKAVSADNGWISPRFALIETLCVTIARRILKFDTRIKRVTIRVVKPDCIKDVDSAEVEITRAQGDF